MVNVISASTTIEIAAFAWKTYLTNPSPLKPRNQPRRRRSRATLVAGRAAGEVARAVGIRAKPASAPATGTVNRARLQLSYKASPPAVRAWAAGGRIRSPG